MGNLHFCAGIRVPPAAAIASSLVYNWSYYRHALTNESVKPHGFADVQEGHRVVQSPARRLEATGASMAGRRTHMTLVLHLRPVAACILGRVLRTLSCVP